MCCRTALSALEKLFGDGLVMLPDTAKPFLNSRRQKTAILALEHRGRQASGGISPRINT